MLWHKAQGAVDAASPDILFELVGAKFEPSFFGTSVSTSINTGWGSAAGYTRYILTAFANLNSYSGSDWFVSAPALGGGAMQHLAYLVNPTTYRFGCMWSLKRSDVQGTQLFEVDLANTSAGYGLFCLELFVKGGVPALHSTGLGTGPSPAMSFAVPSHPNLLLVCGVPHNGTFSYSGGSGITDSDKLSQGDVNSGENASFAAKRDIVVGGVGASGGSTYSALTGVCLEVV